MELAAILKTLWKFIVLLTKYGPVIWKAIQSGAEEINLRIKLREFDKAVEKAKESKDTSGLENIFKPNSSTRTDSNGQ